MSNPWHCYFARHYDGFMSGIEQRSLQPVRQRLLSDLPGKVLEIGAGTGANLPLLDSTYGLRVLSEPDSAMRDVLRRKQTRFGPGALPLVGSAAEALPFPASAFDAVVATLVLCSVRSPRLAFEEIRRVLRPGGRLLFLEHVRGTGSRACWQDRLQPLWSAVGCGCHPNRETVPMLETAGLRIEEARYFNPFEEAPWPTRLVGGLVRPFVWGIAVNDGDAASPAPQRPVI